MEEAKKEFRTIFKQKSANEWDAPEFVPQKKKYAMTNVSYSNVKHQDYLAPFDYENCAKKSGLSVRVEDLIEEISNVTMYQRALKQIGIDEDKLPVSALKKESILEAQALLYQISEAIKELLELRKAGMKADYDEFTRIMGVLARHSSNFYSLIPMKEKEDAVTRPIKELHELQMMF